MSAIKLTSISRQFSYKLLKCATSDVNNLRFQSTAKSNDSVLIEVNDRTGFALVTLNSPPVNSLNLELLTTFSKALDEVKNNNSKGMILTSAMPVFSAGLDINEMYKPDKQRAALFWRTLQDCWLKLYGSPYPTAAAITGHSPAGGCLFSMSCEYRVMLPKFTIGLNETQLGIVAPTWFMQTMRNTISSRQAEMALTLGTLFKTEEALKIGLIDEIATDRADAIARCEAFLKKYEKIPPMARSLTKQMYRQQDIKELESNREADIELFITAITNEKIQTSLGRYIAFLKWRKRLKPLTEALKYVTGLFKSKNKKK